MNLCDTKVLRPLTVIARLKRFSQNVLPSSWTWIVERLVGFILIHHVITQHHLLTTTHVIAQHLVVCFELLRTGFSIRRSIANFKNVPTAIIASLYICFGFQLS